MSEAVRRGQDLLGPGWVSPRAGRLGVRWGAGFAHLPKHQAAAGDAGHFIQEDRDSLFRAVPSFLPPPRLWGAWSWGPGAQERLVCPLLAQRHADAQRSPEPLPLCHGHRESQSHQNGSPGRPPLACPTASFPSDHLCVAPAPTLRGAHRPWDRLSQSLSPSGAS